MAINKLVPISRAFVQLSEETDGDVMRMKPTLVRWAKQADARIGSVYSYETNYFLLDVSNMKAELPLCAIRLEDMIIGDVLDDCPDVFDNMPSYEQTTLNDVIWAWESLDQAYTIYNLNWIIQNNNIVFQTPFTNTEITIKVLTYPVDAEGMPLVPEGHIEAIAAFLQAKMAMKERWNKYKKGKISNMDLAFVEMLKKEYVNQSRLSAANDDNYSDNQQDKAAEILNQPFTGSSNLY
jgi:hypothetical protein